MEFIPQGTPEWEAARLGKFTSSEIHKLMTKADSGGLSVGAKTYANEVLDEIMTGLSKGFSNKFVEYGKVTEELARIAIEEKYGIDTLICGFIDHPSIQHYGGSLDGVLVLNDAKYAIEIKCPFYPTEHRKNISFAQEADTFKQKAPDYYWQCQSNIEIGNCDRALFCSFHPSFKTPLSCFIIDRNESDIDAMKAKIRTAWQYIEMEAEAFEIELTK